MKHFVLLFVACFSLSQKAVSQSDLPGQLDVFYEKYIHDAGVDYQGAKEYGQLTEILRQLADMDPVKLSGAERKAFLINAYNLLVIKGVADHYPVRSVMKIPAFFEAQRYVVAGRKVSLNELEKDWLFREFPDARLHFALICGAKGCPPFPKEVFRPEKLDEQLDAQARRAINDPGFVQRRNGDSVLVVSTIFQWYADDFSREKGSIREYIRYYLDPPLSGDPAIRYSVYDWSLNEHPGAGNGTSNNQFRYVVSATIPKGTTETKLFNNLYTQTVNDGDSRSTFLTTFLTSLYGISDRFSAGLELRYRMVHNGGPDAGPLDVFHFSNNPMERTGVTTIGPKVRIAPVAKWPNFSIQSALWFPVRRDWEGSADRPYLDWNGPTWWTQFFNDLSIGSSFSLFTEVDILWEDMGADDTGYNRLSTPVTLIGSYFPNRKTTLYLLGNYSPYWTTEDAYFIQGGVGAKYQFTRNFEVELLYSLFSNKYLAENEGRASTFNLGIRINR